MQHSAKCLSQQAEMKRLYDEYVAKWPNYCRKCGGVWEVTWQENQSPIGSGMVWLETMSDVCESCLGNGKCPRCGRVIGSGDDDCGVDDVQCPFCEWKFNIRDGGCPPEKLEYPCECVEKEIEEWERQTLRY